MGKTKNLRLTVKNVSGGKIGQIVVEKFKIV
jgi:hypothetical protein